MLVVVSLGLYAAVLAIANTAHLAGLAAGVIIGFIDAMKAPSSAKLNDDLSLIEKR